MAIKGAQKEVEMQVKKATQTILTYCAYCKKQTPHVEYAENELRCSKCGSTRFWTIQGFDASLM